MVPTLHRREYDGTRSHKPGRPKTAAQIERILIHDRSSLFTPRCQPILKSSGLEAVKLPARSPNWNAYAERFVRTIQSECLAKIIPLGERHLRQVITELTEHYHRERNHEGLDNRLIDGSHRPSGKPTAG